MRFLATLFVVALACVFGSFDPLGGPGPGPVQADPERDTGYEYDILSGFQQTSRLSDGWHALRNKPSGYRVPWKRV